MEFLAAPRRADSARKMGVRWGNAEILVCRVDMPHRHLLKILFLSNRYTQQGAQTRGIESCSPSRVSQVPRPTGHFTGEAQLADKETILGLRSKVCAGGVSGVLGTAAALRATVPGETEERAGAEATAEPGSTSVWSGLGGRTVSFVCQIDWPQGCPDAALFACKG